MSGLLAAFSIAVGFVLLAGDDFTPEVEAEREAVDETLYTEEAWFDECDVIVSGETVRVVCGAIAFVSDSSDDKLDAIVVDANGGNFEESVSYVDVSIEITVNITGATRMEVRGTNKL